MSELISMVLKRKLDDLSVFGGIDAETRRNALKEELQFYVLNFIYHHPEYNKWIMYGGSALRIIHGLDRMSVDLDFEVSHSISDIFLAELKKEIENYFVNIYNADANFLTIKTTNNRGLILKFHVGKDLDFGHMQDQVHVKIDLNHFIASKTVTERRPINRDQLSFVILTYNMGALMASKICAIFLRGVRGVGNAIYEEKGRDIYDLLWYMGKKVVPDFDYMVAKNIEVKDHRHLFDKLTLQINKVNDENLKNDLSPLFINQTFIINWLKNWRESYLRLLDEYKIRKITSLQEIIIDEDFGTDNFSFVYKYNTAEKEIINIRYIITYEWMSVRLLNVIVDKKLLELVNSNIELNEQLKQFIALFHNKTENYFKKINNIMFGNDIITKIIRTTTDNLNQKEEIILNNSTLLSCELDDLLK